MLWAPVQQVLAGLGGSAGGAAVISKGLTWASIWADFGLFGEGGRCATADAGLGFYRNCYNMGSRGREVFGILKIGRRGVEDACFRGGPFTWPPCISQILVWGVA